MFKAYNILVQFEVYPRKFRRNTGLTRHRGDLFVIFQLTVIFIESELHRRGALTLLSMDDHMLRRISKRSIVLEETRDLFTFEIIRVKEIVVLWRHDVAIRNGVHIRQHGRDYMSLLVLGHRGRDDFGPLH